MVRIREIPRTATFAWSPGSQAPLLATGTRAGAVDFDFSNETNLELWDLGLDKDNAAEPQPLVKVATESGFHDLAWSDHLDNQRGIVAGALDNGSLNLWDADKLLNGTSDALVTSTKKHSGAVKALQFNPKHSNLLATGGAKGELFITDLNNVENPFRLGNTAARADDIECLDWNKKVAHILVTGTSAGFVTVWDVKTKKESLTLNNYGRKPVSAVAWDPEKPTKLVTSIPLESDPVILVWDLRNSHAPERILKGHESGVLSMSWCAQDPELLLSSGKDNRTICWNPQTGENYGELPIVTNWTFQTRWNPHNPNFFATASFDGKICVQTIQNTSKEAAQAAATQNQALDGEDFFARAHTQPQATTFSLPKTPKWLERPVSASFGFGGRVISVGLNDSTGRTSKVRITPFQVDSNVGSAAESFETALKEGDLKSICESRIASASTEEEKSDWKVIENLLSENPRKGLASYLGFSDEVNDVADEVNKLELKDETNGGVTPTDAKKKHKRLQSIFDTSGESDNFLTDLGASKGARTNSPFSIYAGSESEADKAITRALFLGQFERALDVALQEDRLSDAFMIAVCGGDKCIEKVQEVYFSKQTGGPNYVRLLASIVGKNLWDVVHNADLSNWKEIMATLCTFADEKEFPDLCEALGDRLEEQSQTTSDKSIRKDASFCYLAGSKLEKVVTIWLEEFKEGEKEGLDQAQEGSSFSVHVRALQAFVEKVTVFRQVTNYQDTDRQKDADWKLSVLYEKYIEYADVAASHGRLDVAERYLALVPDKYDEAEAARSRIRLATRKAPAAVAKPAVQLPQTRTSSLPQPNIYQPPQPSFSPAPPISNAYAPPTITSPPAASAQQANPYASFGANPYQPSGGYQATQAAKPQIAPPPQQYGAPPPPRAFSQSPAGPQISTYTTRTDLPAWNDLPEGFGAPKPISRRGTPAAVVGFPGQQQSPVGPPTSPPIGPPVGGPPVSGQRAPPPPPPKAGAPPRITSPPVGPPRVPSVSSTPSAPLNAYAPPATTQSPPTIPGMAVPPPIPRGPSPYNAPPSGPPPTNRYAPSPGAQPAAPQTKPPPSGPYAPQQPAAPSPYAPAAGIAPPQAGPPPAGSTAGPPPAAGSRPGTAQSQKKAAPPPPKYSPGDRSHIPSSAAPIYELLSSDMQRVKARAPASFKAQVDDAERRLNILFDHLNNEDLLKPNTVADMVELSKAMQNRDYETAKNIHLEILTNRTDECGNWMVGVKRLISMSRATP